MFIIILEISYYIQIQLVHSTYICIFIKVENILSYIDIYLRR